MFRAIERFYVVLALLFLAGGLVPSGIMTQNDFSMRGRFNPGSIIGYSIVCAVLGILLLLHLRRILLFIRFAAWPLALALLAAASVLWSTNPSSTFKQSLGLIVATLFGVYLGSCFEPDEQISLIGWMLVLAVSGSLFMVAAFPGYGVSHDIHWGDWKGLFEHKNALARTMLLAIPTFALARVARFPRLAALAGLAGAVILLIYSRSAAAFVIAIAYVAIHLFLPLIRSRGKAAMTLGLLTAPLLFGLLWFGFENRSVILNTLGRDATLTGRVGMWEGILASIPQRPWLGFGYRAFWSRAAGDSMIVVVNTGFNAPHAHNGYLDVCLDVGLVGLALFLSGLVVIIMRAVKVFRYRPGPVAKWFLLFLFCFVSVNLVESNILRPGSFLWVFYVSAFICLGRMGMEMRYEIVSLQGRAIDAPDTLKLVTSESRNREHVPVDA